MNHNRIIKQGSIEDKKNNEITRNVLDLLYSRVFNHTRNPVKSYTDQLYTGHLVCENVRINNQKSACIQKFPVCQTKS